MNCRPLKMPTIKPMQSLQAEMQIISTEPFFSEEVLLADCDDIVLKHFCHCENIYNLEVEVEEQEFTRNTFNTTKRVSFQVNDDANWTKWKKKYPGRKRDTQTSVCKCRKQAFAMQFSIQVYLDVWLSKAVILTSLGEIQTNIHEIKSSKCILLVLFFIILHVFTSHMIRTDNLVF